MSVNNRLMIKAVGLGILMVLASSGYAQDAGKSARIFFTGVEQTLVASPQLFKPRFYHLAAAGISAEQAISAARKIKPGRVLSVDKIQKKGRVVYRVKILGDSGRVSTVSIDAQTGAAL
jgi:uncharacterized membrane protein YkoI